MSFFRQGNTRPGGNNSSSNRQVCKFYLEGRCRYGDQCHNYHPPRDSSQGSSSHQTLPYHLTRDGIKLDLTFGEDRPGWPLSAYGPGKDAPRQLLEGALEQSPEEFRLQYYLAKDSGATQQYEQTEQSALSQANERAQQILNDIDGAVKYVIDGKDVHPNRDDMVLKPSGTFNWVEKPNDNANATSASTSAALGQPSSFGGNSTSAFGKPSTPGGGTAFGQPSSSPAFGQASAPGRSTSAFGQASALGGGSTAFGKPSGLGGGSPFGQASGTTASSPFGQASNTGGTAFGQPSAPGSGSAFGQPSALGGGSTFGKPSPFGAAAGSGAPAFGQSTFGSKPATGTTAFGQASQSSQPTTTFGQSSSLGGQQSAFGQPSQPGQQTSVFGQSSQPGQQQSAFGQPSQSGQQQPPFNKATAFGSTSGGGTSTFGQTSFGSLGAGTSNGAFGKPSASGQQQSPFGAGNSNSNATFSPFAAQQQSSGFSGSSVGGGPPTGPSQPPTSFRGQLIFYEDKLPFYNNPRTGKKERIWMLDGRPGPNPDVEASPETYDALGMALKQLYDWARDNGTFKDGIMPEVPPKREWVSWEL